MKRARMLLRVSSNQQLEADGDLSIQRQLVTEYILKQSGWTLDEKEYFEGSNSGYRNTVEARDVLQEALQDAKKKEYDILVAYKDDRIGRRMWEIGAYIMKLKSYNVDIYTVKDGCISPGSDDVMGQMMLALRYGNAQKSSSDTGMRVKDTAQKMVQKGKFMGGKAPYGYTLELSGEISKHGRALHHLVVDLRQAEIIRYIYELSLNKQYGSFKIAKILNNHEKYKEMAPADTWKSGTINSILTNPIYAGYAAYKRRERVNGKYCRLDRAEWIIASHQDQELVIIDEETWNKVQEGRKQRSNKYGRYPEKKDATVMKQNRGTLALLDVMYCGYCGGKMTNGTRYNYWTIKKTGERRMKKISAYKCQNACQGIPHNNKQRYKAEEMEPVVFGLVGNIIEYLQRNEDIFMQMKEQQNRERKIKQRELEKKIHALQVIQKKINVMEGNIPDAMTEESPLSLDELMQIIKTYKEQKEKQKKNIEQMEAALQKEENSLYRWKEIKEKIPTWSSLFFHADTATKRVLVNTLIERIEIKNGEIHIRFKIHLEHFLLETGIPDDFGVPE